MTLGSDKDESECYEVRIGRSPKWLLFLSAQAEVKFQWAEAPNRIHPPIQVQHRKSHPHPPSSVPLNALQLQMFPPSERHCSGRISPRDQDESQHQLGRAMLDWNEFHSNAPLGEMVVTGELRGSIGCSDIHSLCNPGISMTPLWLHMQHNFDPHLDMLLLSKSRRHIQYVSGGNLGGSHFDSAIEDWVSFIQITVLIQSTFPPIPPESWYE